MYPICSQSVRRNGARRTCRTSGVNGGEGTAAYGCKTGALIPTLLPSSSSAFGVNQLPSASCGNRLIVRAFTNPLAVPTSTVFDPSIGPKCLPCSNRESRGPRRRKDGCKGIHRVRSPNCARERPARLHTFRSKRCHAISTHRKQTVHAGCTRHKPRQQIVVCWNLHTRS